MNQICCFCSNDALLRIFLVVCHLNNSYERKTILLHQPESSLCHFVVNVVLYSNFKGYADNC
jgi:hypothetical protein